MALTRIHSNKYLQFLASFIALYLVFYYFTFFWIGIMAKGNLYWAFAETHLNYIELFRYFLLNSAKVICSLFGFKASIIGQFGMKIEGGSGIRLVYSCLGYGVMSFYTAFVLAWPTQVFKDKWVPLVTGLCTIIILNILRLAFLPMIFTTYPGARNFPIDHHDIFNGILYLIIAGMLYSWTSWLNLKDFK